MFLNVCHFYFMLGYFFLGEKLQNHLQRILHVGLESLEPLSTNSPIHNTVIAAEGDSHHISSLETGLVISRDQLLSSSPNSKDASLRGVDNSAELVDAEPSKVGDGESSSGELGGGEFTFATLGGEVLDGVVDVDEAKRFNVRDEGGEETVVGVDGDVDVAGVKLTSGLFHPRAVALGDLLQSQTTGLDDKVVDGELVSSISFLVEASTDGLQLVHPHVDAQIVVRDLLLGLGEPLSNDFTDVGVRVVLEASDRLLTTGGVHDISSDDALVGPGSLHSAKVNTLSRSDSLSERRGNHTAPRGRGRDTELNRGSRGSRGLSSGGRGRSGGGLSGGGGSSGSFQHVVLEGSNVGFLLDHDGKRVTNVQALRRLNQNFGDVTFVCEFPVHGGLIGFDNGDRLVSDKVTFLFLPLDQVSGFHCGGEGGEGDDGVIGVVFGAVPPPGEGVGGSGEEGSTVFIQKGRGGRGKGERGRGEGSGPLCGQAA